MNSCATHNQEFEDILHLSQKLLKQHLLVRTASFITSLHNGQRSSGGRSPTGRVVGRPSISFSKAALTQRKKNVVYFFPKYICAGYYTITKTAQKIWVLTHLASKQHQLHLVVRMNHPEFALALILECQLGVSSFSHHI
jgi:hypothetical protein